MKSSLVSDCNSLVKKASTRKGEAFCEYVCYSTDKVTNRKTASTLRS